MNQEQNDFNTESSNGVSNNSPFNSNQVKDYDLQAGQSICENQNTNGFNQQQNTQNINSQINNNVVNNKETQLSEKELKKIKKEEKQKVLKAREIIGFDYLITLVIVNFAPSLFFQYVLKDNIILQGILSWIWYIILPFLGAYLIKVCQFKQLKNYITQENYKKIKNYLILDFTVLGFFHIIFNLNILIIPALISYVLSVIYLINEMNKLLKEV